MEFKTVHVLLLVSSVVAIVLSLSILTGNITTPLYFRYLFSNTTIILCNTRYLPESRKFCVQITGTKSNPNEIIILNSLPSTGRSTALGSGFVYGTFMEHKKELDL